MADSGLKEIAKGVERATGYMLMELRSRSKTLHLVEARKLFYYEARLAGYGWTEMADFINHDHSSAIYGYGVFETRIRLKDRISVELLDKYNYSSMSDKKQILEVFPPSREGECAEKTVLHYFMCPDCNGNGYRRNWEARRDETDTVPCNRCKGTGRLRALVTVAWEAEANG
jgi:hypothetical protein